MAEFWIISNLLREKCEENPKTQLLCQEIATQYTEGQKRELRDHVAREENLRLKLEIGNLEFMCNCVSDNNEAQAELDELLQACYKEHLQVCFDVNECEMEKLYSYDSIKFELESRDTIHFYQQLYSRKIKTATKMESRNIVKKYRLKEQELLSSQDELLTVEKSLQELKDKVKKSQEELHELIYRLVKGSKELETIYSRKKTCPYESQIKKSANSPENSSPPATMERLNALHKTVHKKGLSARLSLDLHKFKIPSASVLPRIRTIDPIKSSNKLLQQAADLRKYMHRSPIVLPDEAPIPKLSSILKAPSESATPPEGPRKTVSFDKPETLSISNTTSKNFPDCEPMDIPATASELSSDFDMKQNLQEETKVQPENTRIQILENILIKPAEVPQPDLVVPPLSAESNLSSKRKIKNSGDKIVLNSPTKKKRTCQDTDKPDSSTEMGSKSFMDMFLEFSKDTTIASEEEQTTKYKDIIEVQMESIIEETTVNKDKLRETKNDDKTKAYKPKKSFEDFEDFVSGFANTSTDDINRNQSEADFSFDFDGDNDGGDAGSDNFSLNF